MAERRRPESKPEARIEDYRDRLAIDRDHLDDCLVEQPELYYHVSEQYSLAVAERDATKLDLDHTEAKEAQRFRDEAVKLEEKLTVDGLKEKLVLSPKLQDLREELIRQKAKIDAWSSLLEALRQRSYMLRELVAIQLSRLATTGSVTASRDSMISDARVRQGEERRRRRLERDG